MTTVQDLLPRLGELAASINWLAALKASVIVIGGVLILGWLLRLIFGRGSSVVRSVSAVLSIGLVYLAWVLITVFLPDLSPAPLPFLRTGRDAVWLPELSALGETELFSGLVQLYILACLVNCLESFLPRGKNFISWYLLRLVTVAASLGLYTGLYSLIEQFLPQIFGPWAVWALALVWGFILLAGLLKLLLTLILAAIHPILGAVYGFFFANVFGKQLPKSILTTLMSVGLFAALGHMGLRYLAFGELSLAAWGPGCVIAFAALYIFGTFL